MIWTSNKKDKREDEMRSNSDKYITSTVLMRMPQTKWAEIKNDEKRFFEYLEQSKRRTKLRQSRWILKKLTE